MSSQPSPHELWVQARDEHPDDEERQRARYIALMREHRHLIPKRDQAPVRLRAGAVPTEPTGGKG